MRHLLIAGVMVLVSTAPSAAQAQAQTTTQAPLNIVFVRATIEEALTTVARVAGITIEFDATVTEEMRRAPLATQPIRLANPPVEDAMSFLASLNGMTSTIIGPKAVRISKKA